MKSLPEQIMEHAEAMPEATPICPAALLHLGQRAAVGQALSRLARSGRLMRIRQGRQGVYMRPIPYLVRSLHRGGSVLGFLPTRAYRPGTPGATTFLSPLSGTFNYGWDSFIRSAVNGHRKLHRFLE